MTKRPTQTSGALSAFDMERMHPSGPVTHAPYRREPYVRAQLADGRTVDAKAAAWTRTHVLLHWMDENGKAWNVWVVGVRVRRITAEESAWRDVYDLDW